MRPRLMYGIPLLALFSLLRILPIISLPAPASAQTVFEMGLVGEWSNYGTFRSVEVWRREEVRDGKNVWVTYAGCATSKGLVIVDLHRHAVSSFLPIGECLDLKTKGDSAGGTAHYLYVVQVEKGLCCINITDPSHPFSVTLTDTPGTARGLAVAGNYAFVADGDAGLQIIDIGIPGRLENIGSCDTPGTARGVAISGDYAFVADGDCGLRIIDITNRSRPHIVGSCDTPGTARGVAVSGDYAFVADDEYGIQVIDIADKTLPVCIGTCDTPGKARAVTVCGVFACVADEKGGLLIIDVSIPHAPGIVGGCVTPEGSNDVAVMDDYAYVAGGNSTIQVIDIRDKQGPRITGTCAVGTTALDIAVSGDYAYVAYVQHEPSKRSGVKIVNITDSSGPEVVGAFETEGTEVHGLCVVNDLVYLAYGGGQLDIIDVTEKDAPKLLGTCPTRIDSYHVFVEGGYAYVTNWKDGLEIIDVSDPNNPHVTGSCSTPGKGYGVAVSGDYAYVADEINGLQVINIADRAHPVLAGRHVTLGGAIEVTVLGNHAFVVDSSGDLRIIDISDANAPGLIGHYQIRGDAVDVAVASGYAYIADGLDGVRVFDVSDANAPASLGSCGTPGSALALAVKGDYMYAVDWEGDLYIIDIHEKGGPAWKEGSSASLTYAYDVSIAGDYAFVSDWERGMRVIRISDHNGLEMVGSCDTPGYALGIDTAGEYAYVADWECGLQIIDVSDKTSPAITGRCPTPGYAWDVAVSGNHAFVTDGDLRIIDVSDKQNPWIVSTCDTIMGRFVTVAGDYAYVANTFMEGEEKKSVIQIIDVENRFDPDIMASYNTFGYAKDLAASGDFLYVADGYKGLKIINVEKKRQPYLQGRCDIPGNAEGVRIVGDYAFVAYCTDEDETEERVSGIAIVDITNPGTPVIVGAYETQGHAYDVAVSGSYVYVADWEYGLLKLSIDMAPFPRGNLILVAGGGANPDNVLWPATQAQANGVFQAFIRNGYDCHDIWYQNPVSFQDTDIDGVVNQLVVDDATPTKGEFMELFTGWATASPHTGPLYVWLIGHGAEDRFQIMPDEVITAVDLKACIDQFRNAADRQVVVIIESGASGTYIDDLAGEGVIVITSAGDGPSSIKPEFLDPNIPHGAPAPSGGRIKAYRSFTTALIQEMGPCLAQPSHTPEALIFAVEGAFLRSRDVMEAWALGGLPFSDQAPQMATPGSTLASLSFSEDGETPLDTLTIDQDAPSHLTVIGKGMDGSYAPLLTLVTLFSSDPNILDPSDAWSISRVIDEGVPWYEVRPKGNGNLGIIGHGGANTGAKHLSAVLSVEVFVDDPGHLSRKGKMAIIVAGYRGTGDYLWESTNTIANHAYQTLRAMGYGKHEISYYSPFLLQDLDDNGGYDDISGYPRLDVLNPDHPSSPLASIKQRGGRELLLFLIDHGDQGAFCINPAETLSSGQLIEWMTGIADHVDEGITLIYDACYSGSFLRDIEQGGASLAEKLVTITSSDPNQTAYYLNNGMVSFSYPFFDEWFLTRSLMDAFDYASRFLPREGQTPLASDPNVILLRDQGRIRFVDESRPVISDPLFSRTEGILEVSARVYSLTGISQVWAIAESSRQAAAYGGGEAITEAPGLTLDLASETNYPFGGEYRLCIQDPCPHETHYNLTIYAQDKGERPWVASRKIAVGSAIENSTIAFILASAQSLFPPDEGERIVDQADRAEAVLRNRLLRDEDIRRIGRLDELVIPPLAEGQTLLLYLIGMVRDLEEGTFFYLSPNERISPQELESMLDPNRRLLILMDAPYSRQFLSRINWQGATNWAGIASTPFDRLMFSIGEHCTPFPCFSTFFFSGILSGATVAQAFRMAQNAVSLTRQMPEIFLPGDLPLDYRTINHHLGYYLGIATITGEGGTLIRGCTAHAEDGYYVLTLDAQAGADIRKAWAILISPAISCQGSAIVDLDAMDGENRRYEAALPGGAPYYNAFFMVEGRAEGHPEYWIEWEMAPVTGIAGMSGDDPLEPDEPPEGIIIDPGHTMVVNALPTRRTFYCAGGGKECEDIDWIQFYGREGRTYEIYAQDLSEYGYFIRLGIHDIALNPLYDHGRPLAANNYLAFACPASGYYLLDAQLASPYSQGGVEYIVSVMEPEAQELTSLLVRVKSTGTGAYCVMGRVMSTGEYISPTIRRHVSPDTIAFKFNNVKRDEYITLLVYEGNAPAGDPVAEATVYLEARMLNEVTIDLTDLPPPDRNLTACGIEETEYSDVIEDYISQGLPATLRGDMDPNFRPEGDYDGDMIPNCDEVLLYGTTPCSPTIPLALHGGINPFYFPSVDGVLNMPGLQTGFRVFYYAPVSGTWMEETYGMAHPNAFNALEVPQSGMLFLELNDPLCPVVYLRGFVRQGYTPQTPSAPDFIETDLFDPGNLLQHSTTTDLLRSPGLRDIETINSFDSRKGSWSSAYRFFGRVSGKNVPLDPYEVLIINRGNR